MKTTNFFLIAFFFGINFNLQAQLFPSPENTYVIIVGVLEWKGDLSSFEKKNRKDKELQAFFSGKGIPANNMHTLYDAQASLINIDKALESVKNKTDEKSTIVFYYAGHGVQESGNIFFANYDINTSKSVSTGFAVSQLSKILTKSNAERILLFADCCYSGGLIKECKKLGQAGKQALALTSATACNLSTGNWTFTQTLLDCLKGNKLADYNKDKNIQLSELKSELFQAMKYRERQMAGFAISGINISTKVSSTNSNSTNCAGIDLCGKYFWAKHEENWEPVRILAKQANNAFKCEFYFYSDKKQKLMPRKQMRPMHFVKHLKGSQIKVEWNKVWYKAKVVEVKDDFCYIKYDGYDDSWNEWVLYDRIRTGKEQKVQVSDGGSYYPAVVMDKKKGKYYIHYQDYAHSWDEWVGEKRIKK